MHRKPELPGNLANNREDACHDLLGRSRLRLGAWSAALCVAAATAIPMAATTAAANATDIDEYFCGAYIPEGDCYSFVGDPAGRAVGQFNIQHAYVPNGSGYGTVCEHVYIYGGGTVSRRCSDTQYATSGDGGCGDGYDDLEGYFNQGYKFDARAGNGEAIYQTIEGHAYVFTETCV